MVKHLNKNTESKSFNERKFNGTTAGKKQMATHGWGNMPKSNLQETGKRGTS